MTEVVPVSQASDDVILNPGTPIGLKLMLAGSWDFPYQESLVRLMITCKTPGSVLRQNEFYKEASK
jgi:hypothetical protein